MATSDKHIVGYFELVILEARLDETILLELLHIEIDRADASNGLCMRVLMGD